MAAHDEDPVALLEALHRMQEEDELEEIQAMTDAEVARAIEEAGGDPLAIGERGAELAAALLERRKRLAWQADAARARERALAKVRAMPKAPRPTRTEMLDRIHRARRELGFALAAAFRKGGVEEATDDELAAIVEEIEILKALHEEEDGDA